MSKVTPMNVLKLTLMVALGSFVLKTIANAVAPGSGVTRFLP